MPIVPYKLSQQVQQGPNARVQDTTAPVFDQMGRSINLLQQRQAEAEQERLNAEKLQQARLEKLQQEQDEIAVMNAYAQYQDDIRTAMYDPADGFAMRKSLDARGVTTEGMKATELFHEQQSSKLTNSRQRASFQELHRRQREQLGDTLARHEAAQHQEARGQAAETLITGATNMALSGWENIPGVIQAMDTIEIAVNTTTEGAPSATKALAVRKRQEEVAAQILERAATDKPGLYSQYAEALGKYVGDSYGLANSAATLAMVNEMQQVYDAGGHAVLDAALDGMMNGSYDTVHDFSGVEVNFTAIEDDKGLPSGSLDAFMKIESNGDPKARNKKTSAKGLFQFTDATWARYGEGDVLDPEANTKAAARLMAANTKALGKHGIPASVSNLYLMHQQGERGFLEIYKAAMTGEDVPKDIRKNMDANGGKGMTPAEFIYHWNGKVNERAGAALSKSAKAEVYTAATAYAKRAADAKNDAFAWKFSQNPLMPIPEELSLPQRQAYEKYRKEALSGEKVVTDPDTHNSVMAQIESGAITDASQIAKYDGMLSQADRKAARTELRNHLSGATKVPDSSLRALFLEFSGEEKWSDLGSGDKERYTGTTDAPGFNKFMREQIEATGKYTDSDLRKYAALWHREVVMAEGVDSGADTYGEAWIEGAHGAAQFEIPESILMTVHDLGKRFGDIPHRQGPGTKSRERAREFYTNWYVPAERLIEEAGADPTVEVYSQVIMHLKAKANKKGEG